MKEKSGHETGVEVCWLEWERGFGGAMNHANKPIKQTPVSAQEARKRKQI